MFGLLTESNSRISSSNLSGQGNFELDWKEKKNLKDAMDNSSRVKNLHTAKKAEVSDKRQSLALDRDKLALDTKSNIIDERDKFNQSFFDTLTSWDSAVNS